MQTSPEPDSEKARTKEASQASQEAKFALHSRLLGINSGPYRAIIADDEIGILETSKAILESENFEVDAVENGKECLKKVRQDNFDLVIADYMMQGNEKYELVKALNAEYPELPVILFTGYPDLASAVESAHLGIFDYIVKPMDPEYFIKRAREAAERHRLSRALQHSEWEKSLILNSISEVIALISTDFEVLWTNSSTRKLTEEPLEKKNKTFCFSLWHNRESPCEDCPAKRCMQSGKPESKETEYEGKYFTVTSYPLKDEKGEIIGVVEVGKDITAEKRARDELEKEEEKYRRIYNSAPIGIFYSTVEGKFLDVNPEIARMLGFDSPEACMETVNRTSIAEALYANPDERHHLIQHSEEEGWSQAMTRYRRTDGSTFEAMLSFRKLQDEGEKAFLEGFVLDLDKYRKIINDLSDQKTGDG